jgi:two-component system response regulator NreC
LADDHASMRRRLRLLLDQDEALDVVAEAADLDTARMPNGSGMEQIRWPHELAPGSDIVATSMNDNRHFVEHAHAAGALGFVLKDTADEELCDAIHCAAPGLGYTSPHVR